MNLGFFTIIASAGIIIKERAWDQAIVDICALLLCYALLVVPRIRFEIRASIACLACYSVGITAITSMSPTGGVIWLFSFGVMAGVLLGKRAAIIALLINTVSLTTAGLWLSKNNLVSDSHFLGTSEAMVSTIGDFVFLSIVLSISVSTLP